MSTNAAAGRELARADDGTALPEWPKDRRLREWQHEAEQAVLTHAGQSFLASATPASGKTTFGLKVAHRMLSEGRVGRVVVAGPTTHICRQWAADAARYGIDLEPNRPNADGREPSDRHGIAVTYQTVVADTKLHARTCQSQRTLLIADEPHHMGDQAAWGREAKKAFEHAAFCLLLSGTPFRSDSDAIPWVTYDEEGLSRSDFSYGYSRALVDRVCRPITFLPYDGEMEWISDGKQWSADFDMPLPGPEASRRLRTALDPEGDWMGEVLRDADRKLDHVRMEHPDAGGLVIAADQTHARSIAKRLAGICGERPEIVLSDEPGSSARIAAFSSSSARWLVSVLMVSEGVDIPRLRVGVYATAARTELFFRQVVGRFIRRTDRPSQQMSYLLIPADPRLKQLAFDIEAERRHALNRGTDDGELDLAAADEDGDPFGEPGPDEDSEAFTIVNSGQVELDDAILSETTLQLFPTDPPAGGEAAGSQASSRPTPSAKSEEAAPGREETAFEARERLREERRRLVGNVSRRTAESHREIHGRINRATGVKSVASATREQLVRGNELLLRDLRR